MLGVYATASVIALGHLGSDELAEKVRPAQTGACCLKCLDALCKMQ